MYGVVIWTDTAGDRAIIWCEDHGELAHFRAERRSFGSHAFDAGDLLRFELGGTRSLRRALNPELVCAAHSPDLAERLSEAEGADQGGPAAPSPLRRRATGQRRRSGRFP